MGRVSLDLVQIELEIESDMDTYVPYDIRKRRMSSRFATTTLGASPPLILGFHPSKRHAALIRVVLVILMFVAWLLVDSSCFCCLPSTNIMLFLCSHVLILC